LSSQLTVSHDKPISDVNEIPVPELPPDLAAIMTAWPTIPAQIKAAVKAVLAPYMTPEGGE
jgi:hypothetical protein